MSMCPMPCVLHIPEVAQSPDSGAQINEDTTGPAVVGRTWPSPHKPSWNTLGLCTEAAQLLETALSPMFLLQVWALIGRDGFAIFFCSSRRWADLRATCKLKLRRLSCWMSLRYLEPVLCALDPPQQAGAMN